MRSSPLIELRFTQPSAELLTAAEAAGAAGPADAHWLNSSSLCQQQQQQQRQW